MHDSCNFNYFLLQYKVFMHLQQTFGFSLYLVLPFWVCKLYVALMRKFSTFCRFLVSQGCIKPLCDLLICPDPKIVTVCLEGLENILKVGEADKERGLNGGINMHAVMIDECEGLDKIEHLQTHDNNEIYEKAVKILEAYWAEEEEVDDNGAIGVSDGNVQAFGFGANQPNAPPGGFNFG